MNTTRWIGIALFVFTLPLVPRLSPPSDPNRDLLDLAESAARRDAGGTVPHKADVERMYKGFIADEWVEWTRDLLFIIFSLTAVILTVILKRRSGLWTVLLVCIVMLVYYVPPIVGLAKLRHGFINYMTGIFGVIMRGSTFGKVKILWHFILAPFAYALLALAAALALRHRLSDAPVPNSYQGMNNSSEQKMDG